MCTSKLFAFVDPHILKTCNALVIDGKFICNIFIIDLWFYFIFQLFTEILNTYISIGEEVLLQRAGMI